MSLLEEFNDRDKNPPNEPAKLILFQQIEKIIEENGRSHDWWKNSDDQAKERILAGALRQITKQLKKRLS